MVEDDELLRLTLVELFALWNYRVLQATNGLEALNLLVEGNEVVDLVLSDAVMPVLGGSGLLKQLRNRGIQTPVIMLTGHPIADGLEGLRKLGMVAWLTKPPDTIQLAETIYTALGQRRPD
ncbi:MAG: response regulator [Anaerolineales bacterium]|nr:response regulator [Anaerolineales bacterium]